ncbi:MAG: molybdopterin molybdotransferase MoeA [Candidatus Omnitrophota bacterium]|nr:molybdopterin molybdotransferase MoeA [Candidatus Omnitrophota bacterium]
MIKVATALRTVLKGIKILDSEVIKLIDALERVLAEDVYSNSDIPGFNNSAMDGYALKSSDTHGAARNKPKILEVIEDIKAGDIPKKRLKSNQAARIMTGAMIPEGADSVIIVEYTKRAKGKEQRAKRMEFVQIFKEVKSGENIRKAGEDIKKGELVITKGTLLKSSHIGILASLGKAKIKVSRKPKVAILATGDEVIDVDEKLKPGKLRSSNTYTLYTQVLNCGGIAKNLGIARDKPLQLEKKIKEGLDCDLILTSGGVSVGDYDLVKDVLAKMGTNIIFWKVAMRPGKPLVFGHIRRIPLFGLPGNPVSSMVSFEIFVRPVIKKMLGQEADERKEVEAVSEEDIKKKKGLRYFLRANTRWHQGRYLTRTTGPQGSGILKSMALANSLIILPEKEEFIKKGEKVTIRFLD